MSNPPSLMLHQILLIEGDRKNAGLIREALSARPNLRLNIVPDVVNGIRFLAKRDGFIHAPTPDLVLVDGDRPYSSGTALLEERRRHPSWSDIPVVMLSRSPADRQDCLAHGADGHVVSPTDPHACQRMVDEVFARYLPLAVP